MKPLLDDALAPVTEEVGFVETGVHTLTNWFERWEQSNQNERGVRITRRDVVGSLAELLRSLEPLTSVERRRFLFLPTAGPWTAYFDNGWQGTDAAILSHVAIELRCRAIRVVAVPDSMGLDAPKSKRGRYGATTLEVYGPEEIDFANELRTISSTNDGDRWVFVQSGEPFPFEDRAAYRARNVRDRFPLDLLKRYLEALGVRAFDEAFYAPEHRGVLIEREGPRAPALKEYSIAEVQARWT
jgi:hypothetical protein